MDENDLLNPLRWIKSGQVEEGKVGATLGIHRPWNTK